MLRRLCDTLLRRAVPDSTAEEIVQDLRDEYHRYQRPERGAIRAAIWYARQIFLTVRLYKTRADAPKAGLATAWAADVKFALRRVLKSPVYSSCVVLLVALCIGGNVAALGLVDALMFRPLPVAAPDDLYRVYVQSPKLPLANFSLDNYRHLTSLEPDFIAFGDFDGGLSVGVRNVAVNGQLATPNLFSVLGVGFVVGSGFHSELPEVVISQQLWGRLFDSNHNVIGLTVTLNGKPFQVAGVARNFTGLSRLITTDLWVSTSALEYLASSDLPASTQSNSNAMQVVGRISKEVRPGLETRIASALRAERPRKQNDLAVVIFKARDVIVHPHVDRRWHALAAVCSAVAVAIVLLACSNLAGMILVRTAARQKEFAVRRALGASRWRLARQLLAESSVLILVGTLAGIVLGVCVGKFLARAASATVMATQPLKIDLQLDGRTLAIALLLFLVTCGLTAAPALRLSRARGIRISIADDKITLTNWRSNKVLHGLIVPQVALSVVLLSVALVFVAFVLQGRTRSPGYATDGGVFATVDLKLHGYDDARGSEFQENVVSALRTAPGVRSAGLADWPAVTDDFRVGGVRAGTANRGPTSIARIEGVHAGFMAELGFHLADGRLLTEGDTNRRVAVMDENSAARLWPGARAVGQHLRVELGSMVGGSQATLYEVVGVVRNLHDYPVGRNTRIRLFVPSPLPYRSRINFHVRGDAESQVLLDSVMTTIRQVDPHVTILHGSTMSDYVGRLDGAAVLASNALVAFGVFGIAITALGVFAVVEQAARSRRTEIGIRLALGAPHSSLVTSVVAPAVTMISIGALVGLLISLLVRKPIALSLAEAVPGVASLLISVGCVLSVGLVSSLLPIRRALQTDIAGVLRQD